jgi:ring-1,2-phenylacetyl-CoA epoxidase subunit PaaA
MTMPEEKFHCQFGQDFTREECKTAAGKAAIQDAIDRYYPILSAFFGRPKSKNNEIFRKWRIKMRTNEEMLTDYIKRATKIVGEFNLTLPQAAAG